MFTVAIPTSWWRAADTLVAFHPWWWWAFDFWFYVWCGSIAWRCYVRLRHGYWFPRHPWNLDDWTFKGDRDHLGHGRKPPD